MTEPVATPPAVPPAAVPPAVPVHEAPPAAPAQPGPTEKPEEIIARLEAEVKAARAEAGNTRVNAKKAAADEARQELATTVGKALGIIPDEVLDPAKLQERVSASEAKANQATIELAVFRLADALNANAGALLDSRTFLARVESIDVTKTEALQALITEAVAENPLLAKASIPVATPASLRPNPAQGASGSGPAPGLDAQIAAAEAAGDAKLSVRLKSRKLLQQSQ